MYALIMTQVEGQNINKPKDNLDIVRKGAHLAKTMSYKDHMHIITSSKQEQEQTLLDLRQKWQLSMAVTFPPIFRQN